MANYRSDYRDYPHDQRNNPRDQREYDPRDRDPRDEDVCDEDTRDEDPRGHSDQGQTRIPSPAFNVCLPFQRIYMVQMNVTMRDMLSDFFHELVDEETDEEEIVAFRDALDDPSIYVYARRPHEPSFLACEKYMNVIVIELNEAMRQLILRFIRELNDRVIDEIWAFNKALEDPEASQAIREQKKAELAARQEAEAEAPQGKIRRRKLTTQ
jgi:hypothetical protein